MHFDSHIAFVVSESNQHIDDKFCVVPGLVAKKVLHVQNKSFYASKSTPYIEFLNSGSLMS